MTRQERYRQNHRNKGLCLWCPEEAEKDSVFCLKHKLKSSSYNHEKKKRLEEEGKCVRCGRKLNSDRDIKINGEPRKTCVNCTEENNFRKYHGRFKEK